MHMISARARGLDLVSGVHVGPLTSEVRRIMDPMRRVNASNDSWFCNTPVEVLKIEREKQRAAEEQWLGQFHPTEDAKYPGRSEAVHRYLWEARCGHCQEDVSSGNHSCCSAGMLAEQPVSATEHGEAFNRTPSAAQASCQSTLVETTATASASITMQAKQPSWWEADEELAKAVRQMLQPSFAPVNPGKHTTSSNSAVVQGRASCSTTLGLYDSLIADNAVKAAELGQQIAVLANSPKKKQTSSNRAAVSAVQGSLQTPEDRHAVWVAELANRSVRERQHQILLEAAAVTAAHDSTS